MKNISRTLGVALASTLLSATVATAQGEYEIRLIQYEGFATQVFGVNNRGDVIGNGFDGTADYPFIYNIKKEKYTLLPNVPNAYATNVLGISDSGTVAGTAYRDNQFFESDAYVMRKNGSLTVFAAPDSVTTTARGVNNSDVATGYYVTSVGTLAGFIYDSRSGEFVDLDVAKSDVTIAQGINNKGVVVGSATFVNEEDPCPDDSTNRYGWVRSVDGEVTYFTVNGGRTSARGIKDSGEIGGFVGGVSFITAPPKTQCQDIIIPEDALITAGPSAQTTASDLSNPGVLVGSAFFTDVNPLEKPDEAFFGFIAIPEAPKKKSKN